MCYGSLFIQVLYNYSSNDGTVDDDKNMKRQWAKVKFIKYVRIGSLFLMSTGDIGEICYQSIQKHNTTWAKRKKVFRLK